jgi:hypothetical protein
MQYSLLFALLISVASAAYYDTTCQHHKTSRGEMQAVNNAKMLSLGYHNCTSVYIKFNADGTGLSIVNFPSVVNSFYDADRGTLHSDYLVSGSPPATIDEWADGRGNVCINITGAPNSDYYTESIDQNKGGLGTAWRSIGYYTPQKREVKGVQWLIPTKFKDTDERGDILSLVFLDANNRIDYINMQTCTRV